MLQEILKSLRELMPTSLAAYLPRVIVAVIVLLVFWLLWRATRRTVAYVANKGDLDKTLARFIETVVQYFLLVVAILTALSQVGVDVGAILASLGVVGLTIGFAAKDALSNLISGLFILWDRPFVIGDLIEINGLYGRVDNITLRSTRVVTVDGKMLAIPNTTVVNSTVASYTNFPNIRIDIDVTIGVDEDLGKVRGIFLDLVKGDDFLHEPAPKMVVTALNDYNVGVEFRAWIKDERDHIRARFALREAIYEALRSANVDMPFETLEVRTKAA